MRHKTSLLLLCSIILILSVIVSFNLLPTTSANAFTDWLTGDASSQMNVSIEVINAGPIVTIYNPKEGRKYNSIHSVLLNYSLLDIDGVSAAWYNVDGTNISLGNLTKNYIYFNTFEGNKTLYLYANDTTGLVGYSSVNFSVNNTKLIIIYETFRENNKGNSTNFDDYNDAELENFSNMTLENTRYGKIVWNEPINLTKDLNPSDKITTLDYHVLIANHSISVDTTELPNLNKSATLWFYNLTFDSPRIMIDGEVCPEEICSNETYSNRVLSIVVTSLFSFTLEETPKTPGQENAGGGNGGRSIVSKSNITVDKEIILVSLKQGETKKESFITKNTGSGKLDINLSTVDIEDFIKLSGSNFELLPGKSKTVDIDFIARQDTIPDLYIGKIIIKGGEVEKEILVVIEVESNSPLFDVAVEIPERYKQVLPGGELLTNIKLYSLGKTGRVDVKIEYQIKDDKNNIILAEEEMVAVEVQTSFVKEFQLPEKIKPGTYLVYIKANYDHQVGSASAWFSVKRKTFLEGNMLYLIIVVIILITLILIIMHELKSLRKHITSKINDIILAVSAKNGVITATKKSQSLKKRPKKKSWLEFGE